jgi:hypothetical protein
MDELAAFLRNDQIGLTQQIEMVGNTGRAHDKMSADFADGQVPFPQQLQHAAARRVIKGAKKLCHNN